MSAWQGKGAQLHTSVQFWSSFKSFISPDENKYSSYFCTASLRPNLETGNGLPHFVGRPTYMAFAPSFECFLFAGPEDQIVFYLIGIVLKVKQIANVNIFSYKWGRGGRALVDNSWDLICMFVLDCFICFLKLDTPQEVFVFRLFFSVFYRLTHLRNWK